MGCDTPLTLRARAGDHGPGREAAAGGTIATTFLATAEPQHASLGGNLTLNHKNEQNW